MNSWIPHGHSACVVCRFLGTSPKTSGIRQTLKNLCMQILSAYAFGAHDDVPTDFSDIVQYFHELLHRIPETRPLVLVLDSLDQLAPNNYAHKCGWIPMLTPRHVFIVVSTLPITYGILDTLRDKYNDRNMIRVPSLEDSLCMDILQVWLQSEQRTLTVDQFNVAQSAFAHCSLPLYVRLVMEEVRGWHSYDKPSSNQLCLSVKEVIQSLFERLEKKYGLVLVRHALAYISASKQGLGETELQDLLSLDDTVLTDVFQYHVPPSRRIPPLLWIRIHYDISNYLVSREADSVQVIFWYHRQFIESARDRYLGDASFNNLIHQNMADYYDGKWYKVEKPFKYTHAQMIKLKLTSIDSEADRKVVEQPMQYTDGVFNTRKLNCLPYHLAHVGNRQQLKDKCLFDYSWLMCKLRACGVHSILIDIDLIATDPECRLLRSAVNLIKSTVNRHPDSLSVELAGRLFSFANKKYLCIEKLVRQCCISGLEQNVLLPKGQLYEGPGGPLKYNLENSNMPLNDKLLCLGASGSNLFAVNKVNELIMWDLQTGEVEKQLQLGPGKEHILNVLSVLQTSAGKIHSFDSFSNATRAQKCARKEKVLMILACAFQTTENPVIVVDTDNGNIVHSVKLDVVYKNIGFKENLHVDLFGDELLWHVKGKSVDIFNVVSGKYKKTLEHDTQVVRAVYSRRSVVILSKDQCLIKLYSVRGWNKFAELQLNSIPHPILAMNGSSEILMMYSNPPRMEIVDADQTLKVIGSVNLEEYTKQDVKNVFLFRDDSLLVMCFTDRFVLWNLRKNIHEKTFVVPSSLKPSHRVQTTLCTMYADKSTLVGCYEQYLIFWNIASGKIIRTLPASCSKAITEILITDDCSSIITVTERARITKVWDTSSATDRLYTPITLKNGVRYMHGDLCKSRIACRSSSGNESCVIDALSCSILSHPSKDCDVMAPAISDDGDFVLLHTHIDQYRKSKLAQLKTGKDPLIGSLKIWNAVSGSLQCTIPVHGLVFKRSVASTRSIYVATLSETTPTENVALQLWDLRSGELVRNFSTKTGGISDMSFARRDELLVTFQQYPLLDDGRNCTLRVYDVTSGEEIFTKSGLYRDSMYVLTPDQSSVILVSETGAKDSGKLLFFDCNNFSLIKSLDLAPIGRRSISADGRRALDSVLKVYDFDTGLVLCDFCRTDEERKPSRYGISPDGNYALWLVISEGVLSVGSIRDGSVIGKCLIHASAMSIIITPDNTVAVGTDEGHIMLLKLIDREKADPEAIYSQLCEIVAAAANKKSRAIKAFVSKSSTRSSNICYLL